jgi:DNA-binding LacI/PurR family transcriptional regulator
MHRVVAHLAERGHTRIGYVGPVHASNYIDRRDGFREALAGLGLPHDPAREITFKRDFWQRGHYERAMDNWVAQPERPTAIVVPDDECASWIVDAAARHGLRAPEDIAVTGFNDVPDAVRIGGGLTTVRQPFRQIGRLAAEKLLALIEGAPASDCRISLPTELVVRGSTTR